MVSEKAVNEKQVRDKREVWTLAAIVFAAFVVRVLISVLADRVIKWDEPDYLRLGVKLLTGRGFTTSVPPIRTRAATADLLTQLSLSSRASII